MKIKNVSNAETVRTLLARVMKENYNLFTGIRTHAFHACGYKGIPTRDFHELFDTIVSQFQRDWRVRWQYGV